MLQDPRYLGCSADVLDIASRLCSGRTECSLRVVDQNFDNMKPCYDTLKMHLEAAYMCINGKPIFFSSSPPLLFLHAHYFRVTTILSYTFHFYSITCLPPSPPVYIPILIPFISPKDVSLVPRHIYSCTDSDIPKLTIFFSDKTELRSRHAVLLFQWLRRRATVRCRCRAVHNTSSTSAELGNIRKHSAAGAVTSLDRGLLTHSTDNVLSSVSSTSPPQIRTVNSSICILNKICHYPHRRLKQKMPHNLIPHRCYVL